MKICSVTVWSFWIREMQSALWILSGMIKMPNPKRNGSMKISGFRDWPHLLCIILLITQRLQRTVWKARRRLQGKIGRASCRERGEKEVVDDAAKKKNNEHRADDA